MSKTGLFAGSRCLLYPVIWLWLQTSSALGATPPASEWVNWNAQGEPQIQLYFFWTGACPHCRQARPFVQALAQQYPWLQVHSFQIDRDLAGRLRYQQMAAALGQEARSAPAFPACGALRVGYDHAEGMGRELREWLLDCRRHYSELQEGEGRVLKLGSGNMMWLLGSMLLFYPQGLSHVGIALLLLLVALVLTGLIVWVEQRWAGEGSG